VCKEGIVATKRSIQKPKKPLKVRKVALSDMPAKKKGGDVKGGAPPYVPVGPVVGGYKP